MINTKTREFADANLIKITIGTEIDPKDEGNNGDTYLCIENEGSTQWTVRIDEKKYVYPQKLEIYLTGHAELRNLINACRFIATEANGGPSYKTMRRALERIRP